MLLKTIFEYLQKEKLINVITIIYITILDFFGSYYDKAKSKGTKHNVGFN